MQQQPRHGKHQRNRLPQRVEDRGQPVNHYRGRVVLLVAVACLVSAGWFSRAFALWPMFLATKSVTSRIHDDAERWLFVAERLHGAPDSIAILRARICRRRGDFNGMERELKIAQRYSSKQSQIDLERTLAVAQAGRLHQVEAELERLLKSPGEDGADICDAYTNGLASQGRLTEAEFILDAWLVGFPSDPKPNVKIGRIAEHRMDYSFAEQQYKEALRKNPDYAAALYSLARLLLDRKRPKEALPFFRRCFVVAPNTAAATRVGEAQCLRSLDFENEARSILKDLVGLNKQSQIRAYAEVGFQAEGNPAALELGALELAAQNYHAAERLLNVAVAANPYDLDAKYNWAVALRGCNQQTAAKEQFELVSRTRKALAETEQWQTHLMEQPNDVETRFKVAVVYLQHQSPKLGLYWLKSVLAYDPNHQASHRMLAEFYEQHQDDDPSFENLAAYHRSMLSPDSSEK